jgi:hypothetical protein
MLECWNSGMMGYGIMQCWVDGKICVDGKIKNGYLPFKNQHSRIPPFHYSMAGTRTQASKNTPYFH